MCITNWITLCRAMERSQALTVYALVCYSPMTPIASLASSASAARASGAQWGYPAVVVILACPMMALRASSGAPVWARWALKKCRAARMVTGGSPASCRARCQRRRSTFPVSGCPRRVKMRSSGSCPCRLANARSLSHVCVSTGMNRMPCLLLAG